MRLPAFQFDLSEFDYALNPNRIAHRPTSKRTESKLLIRRENGELEHRHFSDLPEVLPPDSLLIGNETRVIPARIHARKKTGGEVEILLLNPLSDNPTDWQAWIGGKNLRAGDILEASGEKHSVHFEIREKNGKAAVVCPLAESGADFSAILEDIGQIPLPPYISREIEEEDRERYQTVFARIHGSVAAPTAGLHFSPEILSELTARGMSLEKVLLHVGAGTFQPLESQNLAEHVMHEEYFEIEYRLIEKLAKHRGPWIPIGTTSLRTLESAFHLGRKVLAGESITLEHPTIEQWVAFEDPGFSDRARAFRALAEKMQGAGLDRLRGKTRILLAPGARIHCADALITNFHQPKSTLLLLVAALIGPAWKEIYAEALRRKYRFLSYGDATLLWAHSSS